MLYYFGWDFVTVLMARTLDWTLAIYGVTGLIFYVWFSESYEFDYRAALLGIFGSAIALNVILAYFGFA